MVRLARHGDDKSTIQLKSDGGINVNEFLRNKYVKRYLDLDFETFIDRIRTEKEHGKMRFE